MTALAVATVGVALPAAASAAPDEAADTPKARADAMSDRAVEHFNNEEFDEAIDLFERAYELDAQPNYLFNIGRVYEEKGDLANAVEYYQRFVGSKGVDLEARQNATERLEVLKKALDALEPEPDPDPTPATTTAADDGNDDGEQDDGPPPNRKRALRIAGYSLLGVGGAALIVGGVFGGLALRRSNDAADEQFVDDALDERARAKTQARVADAMFITGGVIAGTGLILVLSTLRGKGKTDADTTARIDSRRAVLRGASAWANPRGAGFSLAGHF